jgi:hypothetical protein
MLWYIQSTNEAILNWWEEEFQAQLDWYHTAFWGSGEQLSMLDYTGASAAYSWALGLLWSERLDFYRGQIEWIQNSWETLETKLFQLSELLYQVGKESWAPSELEDAHHIATREIIKKVIENTSWNFAVWFTPERGYFTTETVSSSSSELEIWTYLCSLNKSWSLNRETLWKIFSPSELFTILERYKNGDFWDENIRWLFPSYLEGFDQNMEILISETINVSQTPQEISLIIQSWLGTSHIDGVLWRCELCSKIENYTYADVQNITPEEMEAYKNNPNTQEFYQGLQKRIEFHEQTLWDIEATLRNMLQESMGQDVLPAWIEQRLSQTTLETYEFMEAYFESNVWSICKVDLMQLLQSETSPLQDLVRYVDEQTGIPIDMALLDRAITDTTNLGLDEQIWILNIQKDALIDEIGKIENIPENERSEVQNSMLESLKAQLLDTQRVLSQVQQARAREIEANEIRWLNQEQINQLKEYMVENNLSWSSALDIIQWRDYVFTDEALVNFFIENPEHIRFIQRKDDLIEFLDATEWKIQDPEWLKLYHIYPSLRGDGDILRKIWTLQLSDINLIPESYFEISSKEEADEKLWFLLKNSIESLRLILARFDTNTPTENKIYLVEALATLLSQTDQRQYNYSLSMIPEYIPNGILWADIHWVLPKQVETRESDDYDLFQSTYIRIMNGAQEITQEDKDFIHRFFSKYGVLENKAEFIDLLHQWKIESKTLQEIVPYMWNFEIFQEIIETWIQKNKVDFTELLPQSLHSHPEVIQWTLTSCFTQYESVDIWFQKPLRETQQANLLKASNILKIQDAPWLYAAYLGLWQNSELLRKLFWNKFESAEQLQAIVDDAGETYIYKGTRFKVDIIVELIREISQKQAEENARVSMIGEIKEVIQSTTNTKSAEFARNYLEGKFPQAEFQEKIDTIIQRLHWRFNPEHIFPLISELIKESWIENQPWFDLERFYTEFLEEVQEWAQIDQSAAAENDFTEEEIGDFPISLLQTGESEDQESFEIGEVPSGERERVHKILEDYEVFLESNNREDTRESIEAYLEQYNIEIWSRFWQTLIIFLESEANIITTYVLAEPDSREDIIEWHQSGSFEWLNERVRERIESWEVDYSRIRRTSDILQERGLSINTNGEIVEIKNQTLPQTSLHPENISSPDLRDTYREISSTLNLTETESQSLTVDELKMITENETIKERFIHFRQTLKDLNLESIWQFRNQIFTAIWSLDFDISDGNYIGENELNIFLSKITYASLGKEKVPELQKTPQNIDATYQIIRRENHTGVLSWVEDKSYVGEGGGIIETVFREKFAPKDAGIVAFKMWAFLEALKA